MKIVIPIIKNIVPKLAAEDIVGVQPMQEADVVHRTKRLPRQMFYIDPSPPEPKEGDSRHVFGRGWEVYYGTEWIPYSLWEKIKIKGF